MSRDAVEVIFWTLLFLALSQFVLMLIKRKRALKYKRMARVQETQNHFAHARAKMIEYACEEKIDPNSEVFKFLYHTNTVFMRRPDQYEELSKIVADASIASNRELRKSPAAKRAQKASMNDELKEIYRLTGEAFGHIAIEHSKILRFFLGKVSRSSKKQDKNKGHLFVFSSFIKGVLDREERRLKADKDKEKLEGHFIHLGGHKEIGIAQ